MRQRIEAVLKRWCKFIVAYDLLGKGLEAHNNQPSPGLVTELLTACQPERSEVRKVLDGMTGWNPTWTEGDIDALMSLFSGTGRTWCGEISWLIDHWVFADVADGEGRVMTVSKDWTRCPICSTPRPT